VNCLFSGGGFARGSRIAMKETTRQPATMIGSHGSRRSLGILLF
jgi:hypothetical protein